MSAAQDLHRATELETEAARLEARADEHVTPTDAAVALRTSAEDKRSRAARLRRRVSRSNGRVTVSDHAVVRDLERKYDLDLDLLRAEILPAGPRAAVTSLGGTAEVTVHTANGRHVAVIRDHVVVTVLDT